MKGKCLFEKEKKMMVVLVEGSIVNNISKDKWAKSCKKSFFKWVS